MLENRCSARKETAFWCRTLVGAPYAAVTAYFAG